MVKKPETKLCNECHEVKNVDAFYKGLKKCKPCYNAIAKRYRGTHKLYKKQSLSEVKPKHDNLPQDEIQSLPEIKPKQDNLSQAMQHAYEKPGKRVKKLKTSRVI